MEWCQEKSLSPNIWNQLLWHECNFTELPTIALQRVLRVMRVMRVMRVIILRVMISAWALRITRAGFGWILNLVLQVVNYSPNWGAERGCCSGQCCISAPCSALACLRCSQWWPAWVAGGWAGWTTGSSHVSLRADCSSRSWGITLLVLWLEAKN